MDEGEIGKRGRGE